LWELGGVPQRHRTDRLGAAVANGSGMKEFTARYQGLMAHYGLLAEKTNPRSGHENGDVEPRHHRFKRAMDQALMLRGSRDFADLAALPPVRLAAVKRLTARVDCGSLIHVDRNSYSVNSRLIG